MKGKNTKKFNMKSVAVGFTTAITGIVFLCLFLFYLYVLFLEYSKGNLPVLYVNFDCPFAYFLYLFVLFISLLFFLWKQNKMTCYQRISCCIIIGLFAIYCFSLLFFPNLKNGPIAFNVLSEAYYHAGRSFETPAWLYVAWLIIQIRHYR